MPSSAEREEINCLRAEFKRVEQGLGIGQEDGSRLLDGYPHMRRVRFTSRNPNELRDATNWAPG